VNEEIVYFIFQLELDAQLQRALNYEAYEAAQQIRSKRDTVSACKTPTCTQELAANQKPPVAGGLQLQPLNKHAGHICHMRSGAAVPLRSCCARKLPFIYTLVCAAVCRQHNRPTI